MVIRIQTGIPNNHHMFLFKRLIWKETSTSSIHDSDLCSDDHFESGVCYGVATISRLLEIKVSFAEYRLLNRSLLQKRPVILRSLLIVATPY